MRNRYRNCNRLRGTVEGCWAGGQDCADATGAWNRRLAEEIARVRDQHDEAITRIAALEVLLTDALAVEPPRSRASATVYSRR